MGVAAGVGVGTGVGVFAGVCVGAGVGAGEGDEVGVGCDVGVGVGECLGRNDRGACALGSAQTSPIAMAVNRSVQSIAVAANSRAAETKNPFIPLPPREVYGEHGSFTLTCSRVMIADCRTYRLCKREMLVPLNGQEAVAPARCSEAASHCLEDSPPGKS